MTDNNFASIVTNIVRDSGGQLVGRTRLQKIAYLLKSAGYEDSFQFRYYYYGPYSEQVADGAIRAKMEKLLDEEIRHTNWDTEYSVYKVTKEESPNNSTRSQLIKKANEANAVDLELAATAAYLADQGSKDAWASTENLKSEKARQHLDSAKKLYASLRSIANQLPAIA